MTFSVFQDRLSFLENVGLNKKTNVKIIFRSPSLAPPSLPVEAWDSVDAREVKSPAPARVRGHMSLEMEESEVDPGAEPVLHLA